MSVPRRLPREFEPVEFRPMPGQEDEWATGSDWEIRSPLWRWLGLYPLLAFITLYFGMIGIS